MSGRSGKAKSRTIKVDYLARVEGEGSLYLKIKDDAVVDCRLEIFEPPRFFEALLRGRHFTEAPDITARICGICAIAYQMGAVHAMESICGVTVGGQLRELRRLIYCGEWIESHMLHIAMLHLPDFLGYPDAIAMAAEHGELVETALRLKKVGNDIVRLLGGREVHPVNVRVGGFYRTPQRAELATLEHDLNWARDAAIELTRTVAGLDFPRYERNYEYVCLSHPDEYPLNEGRLVSSSGLDIDISEYDKHFVEEQVAYSTALRSVRKGHGAYLCGPLARYNLNFDRLPDTARQLARELQVEPPLHNPFKSIVVRALEVVFACEEALRIIAGYEVPASPAIDCRPRPGSGSGCTEAPRGICYHRYSIDHEGSILDAKIVAPTSQNQRSVEQDLRDFAATHLHLSQDLLTWQCEQTVRNYDPCISCAAHFLTLHIDCE